MSDEIDPTEAARMASEGKDPFEESEGPKEPPGSGGGGGEKGRSLFGALMHTEPDADPTKMDMPLHQAHFVVGGKKVMDYFMAGAPESGTPAIFNFGIGFLLWRQSQLDNTGDGPVPEESNRPAEGGVDD